MQFWINNYIFNSIFARIHSYDYYSVKHKFQTINEIFSADTDINSSIELLKYSGKRHIKLLINDNCDIR